MYRIPGGEREKGSETRRRQSGRARGRTENDEQTDSDPSSVQNENSIIGENSSEEMKENEVSRRLSNPMEMGRREGGREFERT